MGMGLVFREGHSAVDRREKDGRPGGKVMVTYRGPEHSM